MQRASCASARCLLSLLAKIGCQALPHFLVLLRNAGRGGASPVLQMATSPHGSVGEAWAGSVFGTISKVAINPTTTIATARR
jgi:hypothetical protein